MDFLHWFKNYGYDLLETIAIVASLSFTTVAMWREQRSRFTANLLAIAAAHREIWSIVYEHPELARVLLPDIDLSTHPLTTEESLFVSFIIHHLNSSFRAMNSGMYVMVGDLQKDVRMFFSLPIPRKVWDKLKPLQDKEFVMFVDDCVRSQG